MSVFSKLHEDEEKALQAEGRANAKALRLEYGACQEQREDCVSPAQWEREEGEWGQRTEHVGL